MNILLKTLSSKHPVLRWLGVIKPVLLLGSGGGGNSTSQVYQRNIPTELVPYYQMLLNAEAKQIFVTGDNPQRYKAADFSPPAQYGGQDQSSHIANRYYNPNSSPVVTTPVAPTPASEPAPAKTAATGGIMSFAKGGDVKGYATAGVTSADTPSTTPTDLGAILGLQNYQPYAADANGKIDYSKYVAAPSALQNQSYQTVADMTLPSQYGLADSSLQTAGLGQAGTTTAALNYGAVGNQAGQNAASIGLEAGKAANTTAGNLGSTALTYGGAGNLSGDLGQQIGITGGALYGDLGTQYGNQAAKMGANASTLANPALGYGSLGASFGAMGANYGDQAAQLAGSATQFGSNATTLGNAAAALGTSQGNKVSTTASNLAGKGAQAGQDYLRMAANPSAVNAFMNPYVQESLKPQLDLLNQQSDIQQAKNSSQAAQSSAYGGSREQVMNALTQQGNELAQANLIGQGMNTAYNNAQNVINQGAQIGLQGQSTANQSLNTALAGTGLGMQGINQAQTGQMQGLQGINQAGTMYALGMQGAGLGIQGAQAGLAGVNAANQAYQTGIAGEQAGIAGANVGLSGVQAGLAGTAQGMQGAGVGLSGVNTATNAGQYGLQGAQAAMSGQQAAMQGAGVGLSGVGAAQQGYQGLAGTGMDLGQLGLNKLSAQQSIANLQNQYGAQLQNNQQQINNAALNNWNMQQNYPWEMFSNFAGVLGGTNTSGTVASTPAPNILSQLGGAGITGASIYQMLNKKTGGTVKSKNGGIGDLAVHDTVKKGAK